MYLNPTSYSNNIDGVVLVEYHFGFALTALKITVMAGGWFYLYFTFMEYYYSRSSRYFTFSIIPLFHITLILRDIGGTYSKWSYEPTLLLPVPYESEILIQVAPMLMAFTFKFFTEVLFLSIILCLANTGKWK